MDQTDRHHACKELARRGQLGSIFYLLLWLIVLAVTPLGQEQPYFAVYVGLVFALAGACRAILGYFYLHGRTRSRRRWFVAYAACVLLSGGTWGLATAVVFWLYLPQWPAFLVGFSAAGLVAGGTFSVSSHRLLQVLYIGVTLLPAAAILGFMDETEARVLGLLMLLNAAFLFVIGGSLYRQYWDLQHLSDTDSLTGLANRRHFDRALKDEVKRARRGDAALSLIIIDVDHFKLYNDNYGHTRGDYVLEVVAERLNQCMRRSQDLAARYGGEEFACILPNCSGEGARLMAERIRESIDALQLPHLFSPTTPRVTVSLGATTLEAGTPCSPDQLLSLADQLLYQSKASGRHRITFDFYTNESVHGPASYETPGRKKFDG